MNDDKIVCPWCERVTKIPDIWEETEGECEAQCEYCDKFFKFELSIDTIYTVDNAERI